MLPDIGTIQNKGILFRPPNTMNFYVLSAIFTRYPFQEYLQQIYITFKRDGSKVKIWLRFFTH